MHVDHSARLERGATERDAAKGNEFRLCLVEGAEFIGFRQVLALHFGHNFLSFYSLAILLKRKPAKLICKRFLVVKIELRREIPLDSQAPAQKWRVTVPFFPDKTTPFPYLSREWPDRPLILFHRASKMGCRIS